MDAMLQFSVNGKRYSIVSDLHTHTTWSHGTGSIEDNVIAARLRGLKKVGITDHGPGHVAYGFKRRDVPAMRYEVELLKEKYPDIDILLGVEANIASASGRLDVTPREYGLYDFIIAGIHYGCFGSNVISGAAGTVRNFMDTKFGKTDNKKLIKRNTDYVVKALEKNPISVLTHPGENAPVDLIEVAVCCARTDTLVELNTGHKTLSAEDVKSMALADVRFIITSDAHSPEQVGDFVASVKIALDSGIDLSRIVNLREL